MIKYVLLTLFIVWKTGYATININPYSNPSLKVLLETLPIGATFNISSSSPLRIWKKSTYEKSSNATGNAKNLNITLYKPENLFINQNDKNNPSVIIYAEKPIRYGKNAYSGSLALLFSENSYKLVNHVPAETYLNGVINAEISSDWSMEALKSQAVAARTYALQRMRMKKRRDWHLTDDTKTQMYKGAGIGDKKSLRAINDTRGEILTKNNRIVEAPYHSNSGGHSERAENVWNAKNSATRDVPVPFGNSDPNFYWVYKTPIARFISVLNKAGIPVHSVKRITVGDRFRSGRAKTVHILDNLGQTIRLKARDIRKFAGERAIKSLLFDVKINAGKIEFRGSGNGHGVGLCQWCAKEMAERGDTYKDILTYFYNGATVQKYPR